MKTLLAIAAVAALASSPALARTAHHPKHLSAAPTMLQQNVAVRDGEVSAVDAANPNAVYVDGAYAGADPDINVRMQLRHDYNNENFGG